jgi:RNA polymerase sigma-70 factor (ECF subfamily)
MNQNLLGALYHDHGSKLSARCKALLHDAARADDAVHDAFVKFIENYAHLADKPEASRLLDRIATNRCYDELRRRREVSDTAPHDESVRQNANQEASIALGQIWQQLPEESQELLTMRHVDGMTLAQIAQRRGSSISSVRRYLAAISSDVILLTTLAMILLIMCLAASQARGEERVDTVTPAASEARPTKNTSEEKQEVLSFEILCPSSDLRACAHLADEMYNRKDFRRAFILARGVCEAPETPRSYRLQTCQRAGLLATYHLKDRDLARAMFERGCEGDASRDNALDRAFREESCARAE